MLKLKIIYFIVVLIVALVIGCNKADLVCPDTQSFDFKVGFVHDVGADSTTIEIYHPEVGSFITDEDSPFLVSIPVDVTSDSTSFFIDFTYIEGEDTLVQTDTITYKYLSNVFMEYQECGFLMKFEITDSLLTTNYIDSAFWVNDLINEENELNLKIYY